MFHFGSSWQQLVIRCPLPNTHISITQTNKILNLKNKNYTKDKQSYFFLTHSQLTQFALVESWCNASWINYILESFFWGSQGTEGEEMTPGNSMFLSRPFAMLSLPLTGPRKCSAVSSHHQKLKTRSSDGGFWETLHLYTLKIFLWPWKFL